jgi:hypothetical protein
MHGVADLRRPVFAASKLNSFLTCCKKLYSRNCLERDTNYSRISPETVWKEIQTIPEFCNVDIYA